MFKSKSFDLIKEEERKNRAETKTPRECRYMKYVLIAALIGFMALLILVNVDFSPNDQKTQGNKPNCDHTNNRIASRADEASPEENPIRGVSLGPIKCSKNGECAVTCDGNVEDFSYEMDSLIKKNWCSDKPINATLENCDFPGGVISKNFFKGGFMLGSLTIQNCDVAYINEGAFDQPSLKNLLSLIFDGTDFKKLDDKSFLGLGALRLFKLRNVPKSSFTGSKFLTPFASSLVELMLLQTAGVYDPRDWLKGENLKELAKVDLSGNDFHDKLTSATFRTLVQVEHLALVDCSIVFIDVGTFDTIMDTLRHLDLRNNKLKTLDWDFLKKVMTPGFTLELSNNLWNCSCENHELIKSAHDSLINFMEYPNCATPSDFEDMPIQSVDLKCVDDTVSTESTTEMTEVTSTEKPITASPTKTATTKASTTTTAETTETAEESSSTEKSTTNSGTTTQYPTPTKTATTKTSTTTTAETTETSQGSSSTENSTPTFETTTEDPTSSKTTTTKSSATSDTSTSTTRPQTPPPTLPPTPPTPERPMRVVTCSKPLGYSYNINIWKQDAVFRIITTSPTSVQLLGSPEFEKLDVVYCLNDTNAQSSKKRAMPEERCQRTPSNTEALISDLISNQAYVFCLVGHNQQEISPFNCRSHFLEPLPSRREAWLVQADIVLFVVLSVIVVVACVIFGMILTFSILRYRPTLLKGSKRLRRAAHKSPMMMLYPKNVCSSKDHPHYLSSHAGNNYVESFRKTGLSKLDQLNDSRELRPPVEPAPDVPDIRHDKRQRAWQTALVLEDYSNDIHEYESLEYYQELF